MHGLILTGNTYMSNENVTLFKGYPKESLNEMKRTPGAHRLATHLREQGWDIEVMDYAPAWTMEEFKEFCKQRITKKTVFVGISRMFPTKDNYKVFLEHIKSVYPHVTTIAGSRNLLSTADLHGSVDYFTNGYGENALTELLKRLTGNDSRVRVENLTDHWGRVFPTIDSDKWYPAFPKKDLHITYEPRDFIQPYEILSMELARGCIFKCKFCNFGVTGIKGDYTRSMQDLDRDLRTNYDLYGTTAYYLADETINDTTEKLTRIQSVTKNLPFKPSFSGFMRGDLVAGRPQDWPIISEIGLNGHFYGTETLTHKAGKYVGKGMRTDRLKQGMLDAKAYFLKNSDWYRTTISLIVGLPGESKEEFWDGIDWLHNEYKMEKYPAQSTASALWVTKHKGPQRTSYSEFEQTWKESGKFRETTLAEMKAKDDGSIEKYPELWKFYSETPHMGLLWETDEMNHWEASVLDHELRMRMDSGELEQCVGIWQDHNYVSTGIWTQQDLLNKPVQAMQGKEEVLQQITFWKDHIEDYKRKKLNI
jgi:radical SAM superfamily enzyme YgiQ (UPF0313 family)